ncbi:MAG: glycosyltransferase family 2 protein [Oscillochloridaceae bacterium umkhey_bin13]
MPLAATAPRWAAYRLETWPERPGLPDPTLPLVSIVTPSLNQGQYLAATLTSILEQDYPNLELWVIDAGSRDETLAVLERFGHDPRLRWLSEPDRGQSDAINKGWARCHGQILAWLNADDTYLPGAIRSQVAALQAHPSAGVVYGDVVFTAADGRPLSRVYGRPFRPEHVLRLQIPPQPGIFVRRDLIARAGPLALERHYAMDVDLWVRVLPMAPWVQNPNLVATYRLHPTSKTVAQTSGFYAEWLAIIEAYFAHADLNLSERGLRPGVLADLYAAMANLELQAGSLRHAVRYLGYAYTLAGPRPRMLKTPLALLDRLLPVGAARRSMELWGWLQRKHMRP